MLKILHAGTSNILLLLYVSDMMLYVKFHLSQLTYVVSIFPW